MSDEPLPDADELEERIDQALRGELATAQEVREAFLNDE